MAGPSPSNEQLQYFDYPEPFKGPDTVLQKRHLSNPVLGGSLLVIVAFFWFGMMLVLIVYEIFGFFLECYEARYDLDVIPISEASDAPETRIPQPLSPKTSNRLQAPLQRATYYSVVGYHAMYLSGETNPTDVAQALLPLIRRDASPPTKHATACMNTRVDLVMKTAEASTIRYQENRSLGNLDGVPAGVKDDFDLDGYPMTMGSLRDYSGKAFSRAQ
ncbi:Fc.00g104900.m01.CDS01 [Cosmosporella sp. VM-42]